MWEVPGQASGTCSLQPRAVLEKAARVSQTCKHILAARVTVQELKS